MHVSLLLVSCMHAKWNTLMSKQHVCPSNLCFCFPEWQVSSPKADEGEAEGGNTRYVHLMQVWRVVYVVCHLLLPMFVISFFCCHSRCSCRITIIPSEVALEHQHSSSRMLSIFTSWKAHQFVPLLQACFCTSLFYEDRFAMPCTLFPSNLSLNLPASMAIQVCSVWLSPQQFLTFHASSTSDPPCIPVPPVYAVWLAPGRRQPVGEDKPWILRRPRYVCARVLPVTCLLPARGCRGSP
jgi:hypothetical protein